MRFSNKMVDLLVSTIDFYLSDLSTTTGVVESEYLNDIED